MPSKFQNWRPGQWESIEESTVTDKRFIANCAPTGFGKSPYYYAVAVLSGGRSVIATATKALQDQLSKDFNLFDMRGRQNYSCLKGHSLSCTEGRILSCKDPGCPYTATRNRFLNSEIGLTNYAYLLSSVIHSEGVGKVDNLILDEAHSAVQELSSAIEIKLNHKSYNFLYQALGFPPHDSGDLDMWKAWAKSLLPRAQQYLKSIKESGEHKWLSLVDSYVLSLSLIATVDPEWILDKSNPNETVISPLWPTKYADKYLFQDISRVILVSATLVPKTLSLLNIPSDVTLSLEQKYTFDSSRCPVYLFGSCYMDYRTTPGQFQELIGRMDTFIDRRLDRKGIIHPVSYAYGESIYEQSRHQGIIIFPRKSSELPKAIEKYLTSPAPAILMSPALTTGYDFPYSTCEYQVLLKIPFIDRRSPVMAARSKSDPEYLPYLTAQTVVQICGRAMRDFDDQCETIILDLHANQFFRSPSPTKKYRPGYRHLVPPYFLSRLKWPNGQPNPPPPLNRHPALHLVA